MNDHQIENDEMTVTLQGRIFRVPYASELRRLTTAEMAGLRASIEQDGIVNAILIDQGNAILDGYHRALIAEERERQGRPLRQVPMTTVVGQSPEQQRQLARSLNWHRRHLSEAEKREGIRRHLLAHPERSDRWISEEEGVSKNTVDVVRADMEATGQIDQLEKLLSRDGKWRPTKYALVEAEDSAQHDASAAEDDDGCEVDDDDCEVAPQEPEQLTFIATASAAQAQQTNVTLSRLEEVPEGVVSAADIEKRERAERYEWQRQQNQVLLSIPPRPGPHGERYRTIVIDPPWDLEKIQRDVRPNQVAFDYPTMTADDLAEFALPEMMDDSCHVFMWTTQRFLPTAFALLDAWGLTYVFTMVWHKSGGYQPVGLPQYNCEFVLFGHRGSPMFIDTKDFPTCFRAPRREHSRKPDFFYDLVARVSPAPRIDVFSRECHEGFAQYGNEIDKFDSVGSR